MTYPSQLEQWFPGWDYQGVWPLPACIAERGGGYKPHRRSVWTTYLFSSRAPPSCPREAVWNTSMGFLTVCLPAGLVLGSQGGVSLSPDSCHHRLTVSGRPPSLDSALSSPSTGLMLDSTLLFLAPMCCTILSLSYALSYGPLTKLFKPPSVRQQRPQLTIIKWRSFLEPENSTNTEESVAEGSPSYQTNP